MTTLAVRRTHLPFWPAVGLAVVAWIVAWFITLPFANSIAYDLLGPTGRAPATRRSAGTRRA